VRPFQTPLSEVSAQIDLSTAGLVEFRARSFYEKIKDDYPRTQKLPVLLVGDPAPNLQYHLPAYRFFSGDAKSAVQPGPRMMSVNALSWDKKFEGYRAMAYSIVDKYAASMPDEPVMAFSIGFYNRIPVADIAEARSLFKLEVADDVTSFEELSYQSRRACDAGILLTQVATAPPDERVGENHLVVNNIVRRVLADSDQRTVEDIVVDWQKWLVHAHSIAKDVFWNSLTPAAQKSWNETVPS
jgi:uncharacterized protein (TIGR04255 family)